MHSAAVDLSIRFGSLRVLSEIYLPYGLIPQAPMLSDTTDFRVISYRSNDFTLSDGGQTGDSICVKLLRLYSRSQRKLVAAKQVNLRLHSQPSSECSEFPEVLSRINEVETYFTPLLNSRPWGVGHSCSREDYLLSHNSLGPERERYAILAETSGS